MYTKYETIVFFLGNLRYRLKFIKDNNPIAKFYWRLINLSFRLLSFRSFLFNDLKNWEFFLHLHAIRLHRCFRLVLGRANFDLAEVRFEFFRILFKGVFLKLVNKAIKHQTIITLIWNIGSFQRSIESKAISWLLSLSGYCWFP